MGRERRRKIIQTLSTLAANADYKGFLNGRINQGPGKKFCVPGLNCYSCPGAVGACPLGSLQNFLSSRPVTFPFYVLGFLLLYGVLLGRTICGYLCPFGLIQELLNKIPIFKNRKRTFKGDKQLRWLKYAVLLILVIGIPVFVLDWTPAFCKFLCPAGTLEGGIPLVLIHNENFTLQIGRLFVYKVAVMAVILALCLLLYRPFCKYLCPLGALYALFNRLSVYRMHFDNDLCTGCGSCAKACPMQVDPTKTPNSTECIRCGACVTSCQMKALNLGIRKQKKSGKEK